MPRLKVPAPAYRKGVRLSITIAPKASAMLDELLATGLYGRSKAAVAMWFVYAGLREALGADGPLREPPRRPLGKTGRRPR
jgi:hypothetical protein